MACVDQTGPQCVNEMEKMQSKPSAERRGRGTAWQGNGVAGERRGRGPAWQGNGVAGERRGMFELALREQCE
jgi:hypothetical protein